MKSKGRIRSCVGTPRFKLGLPKGRNSLSNLASSSSDRLNRLGRLNLSHSQEKSGINTAKNGLDTYGLFKKFKDGTRKRKRNVGQKDFRRKIKQFQDQSSIEESRSSSLRKVLKFKIGKTRPWTSQRLFKGVNATRFDESSIYDPKASYFTGTLTDRMKSANSLKRPKYSSKYSSKVFLTARKPKSKQIEMKFKKFQKNFSMKNLGVKSSTKFKDSGIFKMNMQPKVSLLDPGFDFGKLERAFDKKRRTNCRQKQKTIDGHLDIKIKKGKSQKFKMLRQGNLVKNRIYMDKFLKRMKTRHQQISKERLKKGSLSKKNQLLKRKKEKEKTKNMTYIELQSFKRRGLPRSAYRR
jgi:hypothetical protein